MYKSKDNCACVIEYTHTRTSYGIAVISTEDDVTVLCSVENITDEREGLAKFVELCNTEKLEIEHIQNVVEDFLCVKK